MCACGRTTQQVTTSLEAEQARQAELTRQAKENLAAQVDQLRSSAGNALANAATR